MLMVPAQGQGARAEVLRIFRTGGALAGLASFGTVSDVKAEGHVPGVACHEDSLRAALHGAHGVFQGRGVHGGRFNHCDLACAGCSRKGSFRARAGRLNKELVITVYQTYTCPGKIGKSYWDNKTVYTLASRGGKIECSVLLGEDTPQEEFDSLIELARVALVYFKSPERVAELLMDLETVGPKGEHTQRVLLYNFLQVKALEEKRLRLMSWGGETGGAEKRSDLGTGGFCDPDEVGGEADGAHDISPGPGFDGYGEERA